jgi:ABC-2 type transport system permease protein
MGSGAQRVVLLYPLPDLGGGAGDVARDLPFAYIFSARALSGPDGSGLALFTQATGIQDYLGYIVVGTTIWMWQNMVLWNVGFALRMEQWRGTLESNWLSPTWRFSFLLGNTGSQMVTMLFFLVVSALEFRFAVRRAPEWKSLAGAVDVRGGHPVDLWSRFVFASLVIAAREANAFVYLVRGFVMIFCGITYPLSVLPGWMQEFAKWLPPTYIISGIRKAALGNATYIDLLPELVPLLWFGVGLLAAGYFVFNWMERRARRTGAISQY